MVLVRRSDTARRFTLRIKAATRELLVTMPSRSSQATLKDFLERHEGWVQTRLQKIPDQVRFEDGALIPYKGELHRILHQPLARGTVRKGQDEAGQALLLVSGDASHLARRVRDFLKKNAKSELELATFRHAQALNVTIKRISIKDTTSRWGSCSSSGALSYSWRIIMAPPMVLDYLAAHEVAHRREMNHSARFWKIVYALFPDTDAAESWLKKNGSGLHHYG